MNRLRLSLESCYFVFIFWGQVFYILDYSMCRFPPCNNKMLASLCFGWRALCFGVTEFWLSHLLALWHAGQSTILHLSFGLFICNIRIFLVPASSGDYFMETVYLNFRQIGGTLECVILEERKNEPSRGTWPGPEGQGRLPRRSGNWLWDLRPGQELTINEKEVMVHFVWFTKIWWNKIVVRGWTGKESQNPLLTAPLDTGVSGTEERKGEGGITPGERPRVTRGVRGWRDAQGQWERTQGPKGDVTHRDQGTNKADGAGPRVHDEELELGPREPWGPSEGFKERKIWSDVCI